MYVCMYVCMYVLLTYIQAMVELAKVNQPTLQDKRRGGAGRRHDDDDDGGRVREDAIANIPMMATVEREVGS